MRQRSLRHVPQRVRRLVGRLSRRLSRRVPRSSIGRSSEARRHYRLGRERAEVKDWMGAIDAFEDAIARDGSNPEAHYRLGRSLEKIGDHVAATQAYRRAELRARKRDGRGRNAPSTVIPYTKQIELSLVRKPAYAYCILKGAGLARKLGIERISVLEFGVAGGRGLRAMEKHASVVEATTGVGIEVYGFDTGGGLYAPVDYRDMPYFFKAGNYTMDVDALTAKLKRAKLILGDAADTVGEFLASNRSPIGAISFDMDYYSSTSAVLRHLGDGASHEGFLPRVACYFDDVVGRLGQEYNDFVGELLAIADFNEENKGSKIAEDRYFRTLPLDYDWYHSVYMLHRFEHPLFARHIGRHSPKTLAIS